MNLPELLNFHLAWNMAAKQGTSICS